MTQPTDAEKTAAADAQKKAFKELVKEAVTELAAETQEKQRTTGRTVETDKPKSFFEILGF